MPGSQIPPIETETASFRNQVRNSIYAKADKNETTRGTMRYRFDFKTQMMYGVLSFLLALVIVYLLTNEMNWIVSIIVGVFSFGVSGFYTRE